MDNFARGRVHLRPRDDLVLVKEFQNVVSTKVINIGKTVIFNKSRGCLGSNRFKANVFNNRQNMF